MPGRFSLFAVRFHSTEVLPQPGVSLPGLRQEDAEDNGEEQNSRGAPYVSKPDNRTALIVFSAAKRGTGLEDVSGGKDRRETGNDHCQGMTSVVS
ncbi:uncharacterized [Tachysurus ichikawai]